MEILQEKKAEEIAKKYLKDKIIAIKINPKNANHSNLISDLKILDASPIQTIQILNKKLNIKLPTAKDLVFDSKDWEGLRESSEKLTQEFLNSSAEFADKVEFIDGEVASITFDFTKDDNEDEHRKDPYSFWNKIKSKFK